jgi:hypothetical protein
MKAVSMHEFKIFHIVTNDLKGIHEIEVMTVIRRDVHQFIEKIKSDEKIEFLETEPAYGAFLVDEACSISDRNQRIVSATIDQWRTMFSDLRGTVDTPRVYDCIQEADIGQKRQQLLQSLDGLFDEAECHYWFVLSEEGKGSVMKLKNIMYSPLVLSDVQKKERIQALEKETIAEFFTQERCAAFKRRLEEVAYFLIHNGKQDKAGAALAAAQSLTDDTNPADNRFCSTMVHKGIDFIIQTYKMTREDVKPEQQQKDSSALIV